MLKFNLSLPFTHLSRCDTKRIMMQVVFCGCTIVNNMFLEPCNVHISYNSFAPIGHLFVLVEFHGDHNDVT